MKNITIAAFAGALIFAASCTTVEQTATTASVKASVSQYPTVTDLDVKPVRLKGTANWDFVPFNFGQPSLAQRKKNLIAEIVDSAKADILVEPQISYTKKMFGPRKLTVSGYAATFKNFRPASKDDLTALGIVAPAPKHDCCKDAPNDSTAKPAKKSHKKVVVANIGKPLPTDDNRWYLRAGVKFLSFTHDDCDAPKFDMHGNTGYDLTIGHKSAIKRKGFYYAWEGGLTSFGCKTVNPWDHTSHPYFSHNVLFSPLTFGFNRYITPKVAYDVHAGFYAKYGFIDNHSNTGEHHEFNIGLRAGVGVWYGRYNIDLTYERNYMNEVMECYNASNLLVRVGFAF